MIIPQFSIEITVFLTLRSLKTVRFSEEITFKDNLVNKGFITRHSDWLKAVLLFKKGNVFFLSQIVLWRLLRVRKICVCVERSVDFSGAHGVFACLIN